MVLRSWPQIDLLKWSIPDERAGGPRPFVPSGKNYAYRGLVSASYFDCEFDDGDGPVLARITAADGGLLNLAATWKPGKYGFDQCFALLLQPAGIGMPSGCQFQPVLIAPNDAHLFLDARKSRLPLAGVAAPRLNHEVLGRLDGFTFSPDDPLGIQGDPRFAFEKGQMANPNG